MQTGFLPLLPWWVIPLSITVAAIIWWWTLYRRYRKADLAGVLTVFSSLFCWFCITLSWLIFMAVHWAYHCLVH